MKLSELKSEVDAAIELAMEYGDSPDDIDVSIQIDINRSSVWSNDVEFHYDNDCQASGCVLVGDATTQQPNPATPQSAETCEHLKYKGKVDVMRKLSLG